MDVVVRSARWFAGVVLLAMLHAASIGNSSPVEVLINHATGERVVRDLSELGPPSRIYRSKISMVGTKMVMDVRWSSTQIFDIYQFRVRWGEPDSWNDNFNDSDRRYEIECWVEDLKNGERKTLLRRQVGPWFSGYHEKYRFPPGMDLVVQCRVRAINSAGFNTAWTETNRISVKDIPVYFPGINGVDLRGLSQEDIVSVLSKIAVEGAATTATDGSVPEEVSVRS